MTTPILPCARLWWWSSSPIARTGGPKSSIALDQTGYGAVRRVHRGALDRTFRAPYSPGSALSVGNHCFGPWAQVPPLWAKRKSAKKVAKPNQRRGWPGWMPKGPWGPRGPQAEPGLRRFPVCRTGTPTLCPQTPPPAGRGPSGHTPRARNSDPARFQNRLHPWTSLGTAGWTLAGRGWKCSPRERKCCVFQKRDCSSNAERAQELRF